MAPKSGISKAQASKRKEVDPNVLKPVKLLRASLGERSAAKKTLEDIGISGVTKEVAAKTSTEVQAEIQHVVLRCVASIMRGEGFSYSIPARTASNCIYVPELDRCAQIPSCKP